MRRLFFLLLGIVVGGGGVFFAFHYHVVRAEEGYLVVPKQESSLNDAYVDVQNWDAGQWQKHPELMQSLVAHGRKDLIVEPIAHDLFDKLLHKFRDDH